MYDIISQTEVQDKPGMVLLLDFEKAFNSVSWNYIIKVLQFFIFGEYKFLVLGREGPYFVKEHSDSKNKYTEDDIVNMHFSRQHFRGLRGKGFPTDSRHSDGHKLCPSPS